MQQTLTRKRSLGQIMGLLRSQPVNVISGETTSKRCRDASDCRQISDTNTIRSFVSESHTSIPLLSDSHTSIPVLSESHTSIPEFVVPEPTPVHPPSTQLELLPPPKTLKKRIMSKVC